MVIPAFKRVSAHCRQLAVAGQFSKAPCRGIDNTPRLSSDVLWASLTAEPAQVEELQVTEQQVAPSLPVSSQSAPPDATVMLVEESPVDHLSGAWEQIEQGIFALLAGQTPPLFRGMLPGEALADPFLLSPERCLGKVI